MTDKQLASQLDLIERAYLVLTIWSEDYCSVDPDHQKVIDDLQQEIKRITKELERKQIINDCKYFKEYLKAFADTSLQIYEQAPGKVSIGAIKWDKKYRVGVTVNTQFEAKEVANLIEAAPFLYAALVEWSQLSRLTKDELYAWECQAQDALDKARGVK